MNNFQVVIAYLAAKDAQVKEAMKNFKTLTSTTTTVGKITVIDIPEVQWRGPNVDTFSKWVEANSDFIGITAVSDNEIIDTPDEFNMDNSIHAVTVISIDLPGYN